MSDSTTNTDRVWDLVGAVCSCTASNDEVVELNSMLLADQEACRQYLRFCKMHVALRFEERADMAAENACQQFDLMSAAHISPGSNFLAPPATPTILRPAIHASLTYLSSGWPVAYLIATAIFVIGGIIGAVTHVSHCQEVASVVSPSAPDHQIGTQPRAEVVGRITGMSACRWKSASKPPLSGHVAIGEKIALASGLVEITYDTGAMVILQGPVTYAVESRNGGYLTVGRLTGKAEGGRAKGFEVRTPTAVVTDLGTEFGVQVDESGITETHVFVGAVKIAATAKPNAAHNEGQIVHAGQAARLEAKTIHMVPLADDQGNCEGFVRSLPVNADVASDAYARYVLSLDPAAYYRMEKRWQPGEELALIDSAEGSHAGVVHLGAATARLWLPGRSGDAMNLRGPMVGDYATVAAYPQSNNGQLTVAVWVRADSCSPWATIAKNWGYRKTGQFHLGLSDDGVSLHALLTQPDGKVVAVVEDEPFPFGSWQHVALVVDGKTARLYRNGNEVAAAVCNGLIYPSPISSLAIGCKLGDDGETPDAANPGYWRGRIDELVILNRTLPPDIIGKLWQCTSSEAKLECGGAPPVDWR